MKKSSERGVALILTMILLVIISVMAISLTFISKTETWSSMNYRLMSQARNAAEGGVNTTANYLMGSTFTTLPTTYYTLPGGGGDPLTAYNLHAYPVQSGATNTTGHDIILSASAVSSNYPASSVQSTFNTTGVGKGNFAAGNTTVNYATSAKLLSMYSLAAVPPFTSSASTIQTWEITGEGSVGGVQTAKEQVTAILERNVFPIFAYAAFATSPNCSALQFGGGGTTDSFVSGGAMTSGANSHPVTSATDGNIGTNGNLATNGNPTVINGSLSTPRIGTGSCSAGNVTAWTASNGTVTGGLVELPQAVIYPTPTIPPNSSTVDVATNSGCGGAVGCSPVTTGPNQGLLLDAASQPGQSLTLRDISMTGGKDLHLTAGTYNLNSLKEVGNTNLILDSTPVTINITGAGGGTVVDLSGGSVTNRSLTFDPTTFQIIYPGSGTVSLKGGNSSVGLLYAPNATFSFGGNADWYGAVVGANMTDMGGTAIHYDRKLKDKYNVPGPYMLSSFTWNKY